MNWVYHFLKKGLEICQTVKMQIFEQLDKWHLRLQWKGFWLRTGDSKFPSFTLDHDWFQTGFDVQEICNFNFPFGWQMHKLPPALLTSYIIHLNVVTANTWGFNRANERAPHFDLKQQIWSTQSTEVTEKKSKAGVMEMVSRDTKL